MSSTADKVNSVLAILRTFPLLKKELEWYRVHEPKEYDRMISGLTAVLVE